MRRTLNLRDTSGATALEFALVSPVFILLLVGLFELAWTLHCAASVKWSLETSARALMLNPNETAATLKSDMLNLLSGRATATNLTVTITPDTSNPNATMLVAASVYRTTLSIPFLADEPLVFNASTTVPSL